MAGGVDNAQERSTLRLIEPLRESARALCLIGDDGAMISRRILTRRLAGALGGVAVAAMVAGAYFASQVGEGTSAQEGAASPTATPRSAAVVGTPPPGAERGSWTPVPRCPEPTPTPAPDGWILTPDGWEFAPDKWTPTATASPAPWPCVPYDYPEPSGTPPPPAVTLPPEPSPCESCIDLGKPIPREVTIHVAGTAIQLPVGSTYHLMTVNYPVGAANPGPPLLHIIERGESKVIIDAQTGRIVESNLAPADEADFRSHILEPLASLQ
jgi:hypothetical protein